MTMSDEVKCNRSNEPRVMTSQGIIAVCSNGGVHLPDMTDEEFKKFISETTKIEC